MPNEPVAPDADDEDDDEEARLAIDKVRITQRSSTLSVVAQILEVVAIISRGVGLVAGITLALHTSTAVNGNTTHPDVAVGVSLAVGATLGRLIYFGLARALRLFADYASFRTRAASRSLDLQFNGRTARAKECPACAEDVWEHATVCPFCGHGFGP